MASLRSGLGFGRFRIIPPCEDGVVNPVSVFHPDFVSAFEEAIDLLRSVAEYRLDDEVEDRMRELGENKDACSPEERDEHRQLAEFWRSQTLRKLRALSVLKRLRQVAPELVGDLPEPSEPA